MRVFRMDGSIITFLITFPSLDNRLSSTSFTGSANVQVGAQLIKAGANVNCGSPKHWTPLLGAVESGSLEMVQLLESHGADLEHIEKVSANQPATSALALAASRGHILMVKALLRYGAIPRMPNRLGEPELKWKHLVVTNDEPPQRREQVLYALRLAEAGK